MKISIRPSKSAICRSTKLLLTLTILTILSPINLYAGEDSGIMNIFQPMMIVNVTAGVLGLCLVITYFRLRFVQKKHQSLELELKESHKQLEGMTEEHQLEILEAKKQLEIEHTDQINLIASMTHEIRTPVNAILGFSEVLQKKEEDRQKRYFINTIETASEALFNLVTDINELIQIQYGNIELHCVPVSIHDLFSEMKTLFLDKAKLKGLRLIIQVEEGTPSILKLDKARIRQVLITLLDNAIKFTGEGCIKLSISSEHTESEFLTTVPIKIKVEVTDLGISTDHLRSIFGVFDEHRDKGDEELCTAGLSLFTAKERVKVMGGKINVVSLDGKGTSLTIKMPRVEVSSFNEVKYDPSPEQVEHFHFYGATILIADHVPYHRDMITSMLDQYHFDYIFTENGEETIKKAKDHRPNLILLDQKIPLMNGFEVIKVLRETPETAHIPVIAVTSSTLKKDCEKINEFFNSYLRRPFNRSRLVIELSKFLSSNHPPQINDKVITRENGANQTVNQDKPS